MSEMKHPKMQEAIEKANRASYSTRGLYRYTKASHVIKSDGTPLEAEELVEESIPEDPDNG